MKVYTAPEAFKTQEQLPTLWPGQTSPATLIFRNQAAASRAVGKVPYQLYYSPIPRTFMSFRIDS